MLYFIAGAATVALPLAACVPLQCRLSSIDLPPTEIPHIGGNYTHICRFLLPCPPFQFPDDYDLLCSQEQTSDGGTLYEEVDHYATNFCTARLFRRRRLCADADRFRRGECSLLRTSTLSRLDSDRVWFEFRHECSQRVGERGWKGGVRDLARCGHPI